MLHRARVWTINILCVFNLGIHRTAQGSKPQVTYCTLPALSPEGLAKLVKLQRTDEIAPETGKRKRRKVDPKERTYFCTLCEELKDLRKIQNHVYGVHKGQDLTQGIGLPVHYILQAYCSVDSIKDDYPSKPAKEIICIYCGIKKNNMNRMALHINVIHRDPQEVMEAHAKREKKKNAQNSSREDDMISPLEPISFTNPLMNKPLEEV